MKKLVIATKNRGKLKEIKEILKDLNLEILSILDFNNIPEIVEDGKTYYENARRKAEIVYNAVLLPTLADDSGLEVDILGGLPGVNSSIFAGKGATDWENNKKLLNLLKDVPYEDRTARFRCVVTIKTENKIVSFEGKCDGIIATIPAGVHGFGYDPLFFIPHYNATIAQLHPQVKNRISHRACALQKAKDFLMFSI